MGEKKNGWKKYGWKIGVNVCVGKKIGENLGVPDLLAGLHWALILAVYNACVSGACFQATFWR